MCPVCPAETIDQAQVEIARQMRGVVRDMLGQGASRQNVLDFFVSRYGQEVLAAPPKSGVNLLVWILPIVGILAAIAGGFWVIRAMTSRSSVPVSVMATAPSADGVDVGLEPYLEAVDRHLALMEENGRATSASGSNPTSNSTSNHEGEGVGNLREQDTNLEDDLERNG